MYVRDVLHQSASTFAMLQMTFGACLLTTCLCLTRWGRGLARLPVLAGVALATGFAAGLYIGTPFVAVAFVGVGAWGVLTGLFVVPSSTVLHRLAPIETHGRVFALDSALQSWAHVVALGAIGASAGLIGVPSAGLLAAAAPTTGGLFVWLYLRRRADVPDPVLAV